MFDVSDKQGPTYWCVVFLSDPSKPYGNYFIVKQSKDCLDDDVFCDGAYDESLGNGWAKDLAPGLYHLDLRVWAYGPDMSGEYDAGVDATKITQLHAYNPHNEKD